MTSSRGMGRRVEFDERSRSYPVRGVLFAEDAPLREKIWRRPRAYDQGNTPMCVGYSFNGLMNTTPVLRRIPLRLRKGIKAGDLYYVAQTVDEWEGENYDGTSVLAGAKALVSFIGPHHVYRWCFGLADVLRTLSNHGPVVIGVNWYESMFRPDDEGLIKIGGRVSGGHAVELIGLDPRRDEVIGTNSWGSDWGKAGRFRIGANDLQRLLYEDGEAVTFD